MPKKATGLEQLFIEEVQDMYDAEKQLVQAIPKMAKASSDEELSQALTNHLEVTKGHVQRLEEVFASLEMKPKGKPCAGIKGIVEEGKEAIEELKGEEILNTAIAGGCRKVEHYEMMAYEAIVAMARQLGHNDAAKLLSQNLAEEQEADKELSQIAKRLVQSAGTATGQNEEEEASDSKPRTRHAG